MGFVEQLKRVNNLNSLWKSSSLTPAQLEAFELFTSDIKSLPPMIQQRLTHNILLHEKLSKLKIYSIGIDENLVLDWNFGMGDNDELYLKYCSAKELILPPSDDEYITYADMYRQ